MLRPETYIGPTAPRQEENWVLHPTLKNKFIKKNITYVPGLAHIFEEILVNAADNVHRQTNQNLPLMTGPPPSPPFSVPGLALLVSWCCVLCGGICHLTCWWFSGVALKVDIDKAEGRISIWNNGAGIPVEIHPTEKIYVPTMIFGHLLTSSNFDDGEKRIVGGRNGYGRTCDPLFLRGLWSVNPPFCFSLGAKLANAFSTAMEVQVYDATQQLLFEQLWKVNMSQTAGPTVKQKKGKENWIRVTFWPDWARFGLPGLTDDIISLLSKRVHDMAGILRKKLKVMLNGEILPIHKFEDYTSFYFPVEGEEDRGSEVKDAGGDEHRQARPRRKIVHQIVNDRWGLFVFPSVAFVPLFHSVLMLNVCCCPHSIRRWQIAVAMSTSGQLQQVSFVNAICTKDGGTHVKYIAGNLEWKGEPA